MGPAYVNIRGRYTARNRHVTTTQTAETEYYGVGAETGRTLVEQSVDWWLPKPVSKHATSAVYTAKAGQGVEATHHSAITLCPAAPSAHASTHLRWMHHSRSAWPRGVPNSSAKSPMIIFTAWG